MSSPLQNNITNLQSLLDAVNALPEAGGISENLDAELNAQTEILSEQNTKILELSEILSNKAGNNMPDIVYVTIGASIIWFERGMTWGDYINSKYNILVDSNATHFTLVNANGNVGVSKDDYTFVDKGAKLVKLEDVIIPYPENLTYYWYID